MSTNPKDAAFARFDDPRNISRGRGRVIWAASTTNALGVYHPEGWVLPGGARTTDKARAERVADRIHDITLNPRKH